MWVPTVCADTAPRWKGELICCQRTDTSAGCWCIAARLPLQQTQTTILGILRNQDTDGGVIAVMSGYHQWSGRLMMSLASNRTSAELDVSACFSPDSKQVPFLTISLDGQGRIERRSSAVRMKCNPCSSPKIYMPKTHNNPLSKMRSV